MESAAIAQTLLTHPRPGPGMVRTPRLNPGKLAEDENADGEVKRGMKGGMRGEMRGGSRGQLLLLLVEARLETGELGAVWWALVELARTPLGLTEALQRMALRTRYELMAGYPTAVLEDAERKAALSELMPGPQCGAFCAMLAEAAHQVGDAAGRRRWALRVDLLCTPEQVARMRERGVGRAGQGA